MSVLVLWGLLDRGGGGARGDWQPTVSSLGIGESFFMVVEAFLRQLSKGDPSSSLVLAPLSATRSAPPGGDRAAFPINYIYPG